MNIFKLFLFCIPFQCSAINTVQNHDIFLSQVQQLDIADDKITAYKNLNFFERLVIKKTIRRIKRRAKKGKSRQSQKKDVDKQVQIGLLLGLIITLLIFLIACCPFID